MIYDKKEFSEKELYYIREAERIGSKYGNCKKLSDLSRQAYADMQNKIISGKAYDRIYIICMNYAYPIP